MRAEQFGLGPRLSTFLWLARLVERITRNFGEKRLTGAVFLDVAKSFDTVGIDGLLYNLTLRNVPSYSPYNLILPQWSDVRSVLPGGHVISSRHAGWGSPGGIDLPCPLHLYVNMHPPSHHVDLALYADDTTIIATSRKLTLLVTYLELCLNELQRWLREWRIANNVSKNTAIIFAPARRRFIQPRPVTLRGTNGMGRHYSLSGGDPRYTTHLVASHRPGQEEDCSKDGYGGRPPE